MLTDDEISKLCMTRLSAIDTNSSTIQSDRETAMEYYNSEPFGDEVDGRSAFVTSDVLDTIEWILPQLVDMFIGPDAPGSFSARNADDAEAARTESAYIQDVFNNQNNGFLITYEWFKDALLQKNGYVKSYWDERVDEVQETYEDQTYDQYLALAADDDIEIKAATFKLEDKEYSRKEIEAFPPEVLALVKVDIECERSEDNSKPAIETIAPENFFTDLDHPSIDLSSAKLCCERLTVTASDLLVDGYDRDLIDSIPAFADGIMDSERQERFSDEGGGSLMLGVPLEDESQKQILVHNFYIRLDADGDGKAELRFIKLAGPNGEVVLENEEADSVPYSAITPLIVPHKHYGKSIADIVKDLQRLRSILWRQVLDNLYLSNNPIKRVDPQFANTEDLLTAAPGSIWRGKAESIEMMSIPFVAGPTLEVLPLVDEMKQERTGVSPASQGLNIDALADSTNIVGPMIMTQAMQRIRMIARIFAETGFKHLMLRIHELCSKHDTSERVFESAGEYVQTDPRLWAKRKSWNVRVGVGHVDRLQRLQAIQTVVTNQKEIATTAGLESPVLGAQQFYAALVEQAKLLGYADGAKFYRDPQTFQPPPPKKNVAEKALEVEHAKTIADVEKTSVKTQYDTMVHRDEMAFEEKKLSADMALQKTKMDQDYALKREELALKYAAPLKQRKKHAGTNTQARSGG